MNTCLTHKEFDISIYTQINSVRRGGGALCNEIQHPVLCNIPVATNGGGAVIIQGKKAAMLLG